MGTLVTFWRVAVVIVDVHGTPGRTFGTWPSIVTVTLKFVARVVDPADAAIGLLPTSVTLARNVLSGSASTVTFAGWPIVTLGISVSSTSISAWMTDMSAIVMSATVWNWLPATISPMSTLRFVTTPSIGEVRRILLKSYWAFCRFDSV